MWHTLAFVAESRSVDAAELTAFAEQRADKYGIVDEGQGPEVNTWHVNELVRDFKMQAQGQAILELTP